MNIRKGDLVEILPQFQDPSDDEFRWLAVDDEEKGRVTIAALGTNLRVAPTTVVRADWVKLVIF